jgi:hypothetical protein
VTCCDGGGCAGPSTLDISMSMMTLGTVTIETTVEWLFSLIWKLVNAESIGGVASLRQLNLLCYIHCLGGREKQCLVRPGQVPWIWAWGRARVGRVVLMLFCSVNDRPASARLSLY